MATSHMGMFEAGLAKTVLQHVDYDNLALELQRGDVDAGCVGIAFDPDVYSMSVNTFPLHLNTHAIVTLVFIRTSVFSPDHSAETEGYDVLSNISLVLHPLRLRKLHRGQRNAVLLPKEVTSEILFGSSIYGLIGGENAHISDIIRFFDQWSHSYLGVTPNPCDGVQMKDIH
jgi:hypothetical protein